MLDSLLTVDMLRLYAQPHRRYHDVQHVLDLFQLLHEGQARGIALGFQPERGLLGPELWWIENAILAHDCVYDPTAQKGVNEQMSYGAWALLARARHHPVSIVDDYVVNRMITATVDHEMPEDLDPAYRNAVALFLDLDMSALAVDWEQWEINTEALREEYSHVDRETFDAGRLKFLQSTLDKPQIYHHETMRDVLEKRARQNIERAIREMT